MLPSKNYPPANLAKMIKECEAAGEPKLGQKIMDQWNRTTDKYPVVMTSWGAATNIGTRSVKKNVFGGLEFSEWLYLAKQGVAKPIKPRRPKAA